VHEYFVILLFIMTEATLNKFRVTFGYF